MVNNRATSFYVTEVQYTHPEMHPYKVILHRDWGSYFKDFRNMQDFNNFCASIGVSYEQIDAWNNGILGNCKKYTLSHFIDDPYDRSFWSLDELPKGAHKITLMENGHNVTCYFLNDGCTVHIYRPNPNAKDVYRLY